MGFVFPGGEIELEQFGLVDVVPGNKNAHDSVSKGRKESRGIAARGLSDRRAHASGDKRRRASRFAARRRSAVWHVEIIEQVLTGRDGITPIFGRGVGGVERLAGEFFHQRLVWAEGER